MIKISNIKRYEPLWGQWYVDSLVGEGSFGKVYKVWREESGQTIYAAVKVLSIPFDDAEKMKMQAAGLNNLGMREFSQDLVKKIINEISLCSRNASDSLLVNYRDIEVHEKDDEISWDILLLMDFFASLGACTKDRPFSQAEVVILGIHICRALALCAENDTVHLNIIPNNIFISPSGTFLLGDIGIAKHIELDASGLAMRGTYTTMAPEVFKGETFDTSADTYALGMLMYGLLNRNRAPFLPPYPQTLAPNDIDQALQKRISGEPLPVLRGVSPELNALLQKTCAYNRQDRFSDSAAMCKALETIASIKGYDENIITKTMEPLSKGTMTAAVNQGILSQTGLLIPRQETVLPLYKMTSIPNHPRNDQNAIIPTTPVNQTTFLKPVDSQNEPEPSNQIGQTTILTPDDLLSEPEPPNQIGQTTILKPDDLLSGPEPPNQIGLSNQMNPYHQTHSSSLSDFSKTKKTSFLRKKKLPLIVIGLSLIVMLLIIIAAMNPTKPSATAQTVYGISINSRSEIILSDRESADAALDELIRYYTALAEAQNSNIVSSASFEENVEVIPIQDQPEGIAILSKEEALEALVKGKTQVVEHVVEPEETIQTIAEKFKVTSQSITSENEGLTEEDQLLEGTLIRLVIAQPYLHVILHGQRMVTGEIDFSTEKKKDDNVVLNTTEIQQKGEKGTKIITLAYRSKNGIIVEENVLSEIVTAEPVNEIILEGTKPLIITFNTKSLTNEKLSSMVESGEIPKNVTHLYLDSNQISDITPLKSLTGLVELHLNSNKISDLTPLQSLTSLTTLNMDKNSIKDLTPLKSLTKLTVLSLNNNKISNISPLKSLTRLTHLSLNGNDINDFSPTKSLLNLQELHLGNNPGQAQMLDLRDTLPNCNVTD